MLYISKRGIIEILSDIKEALNRINIYHKNLNSEQFLKDFKTQDAIIRNFEILGEAVKLLPDNFKKQYYTIPWNKIAGIRDRLIHQYFGVNFEIIWTIIEKDLPGFQQNIDEILLKRQESKSEKKNKN